MTEGLSTSLKEGAGGLHIHAGRYDYYGGGGWELQAGVFVKVEVEQKKTSREKNFDCFRESFCVGEKQ